MNHLERSLRNFLANNPLDRQGVKRRDNTWLEEQLHNPATRIVPMWQSKNLFVSEHSPTPIFVTPDIVADLLPTGEPIFLGTWQNTSYFALDIVSETPPEAITALGSFQDLRFRPGIDPQLAAILGYAKGLIYWHSRHRYCSDCGSPSASRDGGFVRICMSSTCGKSHFPRTDMAIIVVVHGVDEAGNERCLLARQPTWPPGRYSVIAGFVEPGESLEAAVAREVKEETDIDVQSIEYHSSQPWPFPGSLMLGFMAQASSHEITTVDQELEHARWFTRQELKDSIVSGQLKLPPMTAISYRLIESWFDGPEGKLSDLTDGGDFLRTR
ncbi:MAG: NAD(+) diphosphatase [Caldilineaceae bacterium]